MFKKFCCCNAAVSDLYNGKNKNKIAIIFFVVPMAVKNIQFRMKLLYKAPTKQQQNILILWDCSSYEKHQKYVTCCSAGYIRWVDLYNIYDKDKELKSNLRKPPKLSYLALHPGNNKENVPLALETTITAARSYFPN